MATDQYIKANPEVVQTWTNAIFRAQKWTDTAAIPELVAAIEQFFPGIDQKALAAATARYQKLKIWKSTPVIEPAAIEKFQDILVHGNVLEQNKRVKFQDLVLTDFAAKAK
jgi:NitT/TauT family transport system substrate-binding protein